MSGAAAGGPADGSAFGRESTDRRHQRGKFGIGGRVTAEEIRRELGVGQVEQAVEMSGFSA